MKADLQAFADADWQAAKDRLGASIGAEKADLVMKFQDDAYREAVSLLRQFGLNEKIADDIMALKRDTLAAVVTIRVPQTDIREADEMVKQKHREALARMESLLGRDALAACLKSGEHVEWLR